MKRKGKLICLVAFAAVLCCSVSLFAAQGAGTQTVSGEDYSLVLEMYEIENYSAGVKVTDPNGKEVSAEDDSFLVETSGTYTIAYPSGTCVLLHSYIRRVPSSFRYGAQLEEEYIAGETILLPKAFIENEICDYTEYKVTVSADGQTIEEITTEIPAGGKSYRIPKAGNYTIAYTYTDVFGVEESDELFFAAKDEKIVFLDSELPAQISYGDSLTVSAYGYYRETQYVTKNTVLTPSGILSDVAGRKYTPTERGEYTFTFTANIEGEQISQTRKVFVEYTTESLFANAIGITDVSSGAALPAYSQMTGNSTLIRASSSGSSIMYNKVIDLTEFGKDDNLIEFEMYSDGVAEASAVQVTLIDVYNEANTLTVYWWANPWSTNMSYMLVRCNGLSLGRDNESGSNLPRGENDFGTNSRNTFSGYKNKNSLPFNFQYDYKEKAVYSYVLSENDQYNILDLDNAAEIPQANLWSGFTADLVLMKIEFVQNNNAGMYITELAGEDMGSGVLVTPKDDNLLCLTSEYETLPDGAVGYPYRLPSVLEQNAALGELSVARKLFFGEEEISAQISNGRFTPASAGEYAVEFSAKDAFGNTVVKRMEFTVNEKPNPISFDIDENQSVQIMGYYSVPEIVAAGGSGNIETLAEVYMNGELLSPDINNRYKIEEEGELELRVTATDFLGYSYTQNYPVEITKNLVYIDISGVPDAVRAGSTVTFPSATAYDYNADSELPTKFYVNGAEADLRYTVPEDAESLLLRYTINEGLAGEESREYTVKVIPKTIQNQHDFLIFENADVLYLDPGIVFTPGNTEDFSLKAPYPLPVDKLNLSFSVNENAKGFGAVEIVLTDYYHAEERVVLSVSEIAGQTAKLSVNGGAATEISYYENTYLYSYGMGDKEEEYLGKKYDTFEFVFRNNDCRVQNASGKTLAMIDSLENGDRFRGFSSGLIRLEIRLADITGYSQLVLSGIGNQLFNYHINGADFLDKDNIGALLFSDPISDTDVKIDTEFTVPAAQAYDVLQQTSSVTLTVTDPNGNAVCKDIAVDEDYTFRLSEYGGYSVQYTTVDSIGRTASVSYRITAIDEIAPVLSVSGSYAAEAAVNDAIAILGASAVDNVDEEVAINIFVRRPDSRLIVVRAGENYTFTEKGDYTVVYLAIDSQYNVARREFSIKVK